MGVWVSLAVVLFMFVAGISMTWELRRVRYQGHTGDGADDDDSMVKDVHHDDHVVWGDSPTFRLIEGQSPANV